MKKLIITACLMLAVQGLIAQKKAVYSITGNIKGVPNGTIFYLIRSSESGKADTVSKVKSIHGTFSIKGSLKLTPELHFIKMDTSVVKLEPKTNSWIRVLLDNVPVSITGNLKNWPNVNLQGSTATSEYEKICSVIRIRFDEEKNKLENGASILKSYPNAYATPCIAVQMSRKLTIDQTEEIYNGLSANVKSSFYGQKLKSVVNSLRIQEKVDIGKVIPEFFIIDEQGKRQSIIQLAKQAKYTLIDFWAYWCAPCRAALPNIKKVYSAYKNKGFNVIGVSTDSNVVAWKKALKEEDTPWINGIQEGRVSSEIFAMNAIPGYILINERAEILVMDFFSPITGKSIGSLNGMPAMVVDKRNTLHGEHLNKKIESLLGDIKGN